jgi:5-methylcytosine-specific restriction endonuclease McrA
VSDKKRTAKPRLKGETKRLIRAYVAERDGAVCHYCRTPFGTGLAGATLDHYVPYRLWQMNKPRNLVLACGPCNNAKGDALPLTLVWLLLAHFRPEHFEQAA